MPVTAEEAALLVGGGIAGAVAAIYLLHLAAPTLFMVQPPVPVRPISLPPANAFNDDSPRGLGAVII